MLLIRLAGIKGEDGRTARARFAAQPTALKNLTERSEKPAA
jgi:hypothetical protein